MLARPPDWPGGRISTPAVSADAGCGVAAATAGGPRVSRAALGSEIGLARRESPHRGERLMAMARILVADMPCTLAALE